MTAASQMADAARQAASTGMQAMTGMAQAGMGAMSKVSVVQWASRFELWARSLFRKVQKGLLYKYIGMFDTFDVYRALMFVGAFVVLEWK